MWNRCYVFVALGSCALQHPRDVLLKEQKKNTLETATDLQTKTLHSFQQGAPAVIPTAPCWFFLACTAVAARGRQSEVKGHKLEKKNPPQIKPGSKRLGLNGRRSRKQYVKARRRAESPSSWRGGWITSSDRRKHNLQVNDTTERAKRAKSPPSFIFMFCCYILLRSPPVSPLWLSFMSPLITI